MKEICYEFVELESDESFRLLGKAFGGILRNNTLLFSNSYVEGELIKSAPENGLWIRKWKLTVFQKIKLHRNSAPKEHEKKFSLIYFLNPSIFDLKERKKKISVNKLRNNLFVSNEVMMDFSVLPKQPFYVVDITFTDSWLLQQFEDVDPCFRKILDLYLTNDTKAILAEPCNAEEYKMLHELDEYMLADSNDVLFIRSRVYNLICSFFGKVYNISANLKQSVVHYEQIVRAEAMIIENLHRTLKIEEIAKKVNMSASSLLRQYKLMFGKSIQEYYIEKKMELAKKMIMERGIKIKEVAQTLGYKQTSPFIEIFTKQYGYSPGSLMGH
jgi:AraC-like DNA-binding protein